MNSCPLGCGRGISERQILCRQHWDRVPPKLQAPIQALKKERGSDAWKAAVQEAVGYLSNQQAIRRELEQQLDDYYR